MNKLLIVSVSALMLAGCTAREQQVLTAGAVGAVTGAVIANEVAQPPRRPVHYEEHYVPLPPRRPRCFTTWEHYRGAYVERRICDRY